MQTLANTKTIRNIVNNIVGTSAKYTDKGVNNTRLLTWQLRALDTAALKEIKDIFALVGFTNRIKVTRSTYNAIAREGGRTYLRINASYNK